jgi:aminopeptidase N
MSLTSRVILGAWFCAAMLHADNYPRQTAIDVEHYTFRVTLNDENDEIAGETTVAIRFTKAGVTQFWLDLASAAGGKGMTVSSVSSGDAALNFSHASDRLTITLPAAPQPGERRAVTVNYRGIPASGLRAVKNKYGERCFFSANWPDQAHQWLPTIDHPYDKATSEFFVTAPARYQVVANGLLRDEVDLGDGLRRTHWKQSVPIATWLNNIGVAQFASLHFGTAAGAPLQTWVFPKDLEAGIATFNAPMRQAIEFFSDHIGPYPYEKLASVQNGAAAGGGMEHASAIFYGQNSVSGRPALGLVSHEIAHQWFGDSVTEKDWDDVWLSEGFATYFSALAIEHYQGRDAFLNVMQRSRAAIFAAEKRLAGVAVVQTKAWSGIPNGIVYQKGAWSLHMLRDWMGDEKFWSGIREYYRRYRDSNASTADFMRVMEEASGAKLGWFFDQWIYRPGSPVVEGWWRYNPLAKRIDISLRQTQGGAPYRLSLEVAAGPKTETIEMTGARQTFEIAADSEPASVTLDPNVRTLMDAKFEKK